MMRMSDIVNRMSDIVNLEKEKREDEGLTKEVRQEWKSLLDEFRKGKNQS